MKQLVATGKYTITVLDAAGNIRQQVTAHNRVVNGGLANIASLLAGSDNDDDFLDRPQYCGIGSESNDVTSDDVALVNELYRKQCDSIKRDGNSIEFNVTFGADQPELNRARICEVGMFNELTDGTMFNRCVFSQVTKYNTDTLIIKYVLTIAAQETVYDDVENIPDETPPLERIPAQVTITQPGNGTITVTDDQNIRHTRSFESYVGAIITINCAPADGYQLDWLRYGSSTIDNGARRNVTGPVTITGRTSEIPPAEYQISIVQPNNGVLVANNGTTDYTNPFVITEGTQVSFMCTANEGYRVDSIQLTNASSGQTITVPAGEPQSIDDNVVVTANISLIPVVTRQVVITQPENGSIAAVIDGDSYQGTFNVAEGTVANFNVTVNQGYVLQSLTVNNNVIDTTEPYKIVDSSNVTATIVPVNGEISVVNLTHPDHGTIVATYNNARYNSTFTVPTGSRVSCTVDANEGYQVSSLMKDGRRLGQDVQFIVNDDVNITATTIPAD